MLEGLRGQGKRDVEDALQAIIEREEKKERELAESIVNDLKDQN